MRTLPLSRRLHAFTFMELLLMLVFLLMLVLIFAPMILSRHGGPRKAPRVVCMSNLKQVGVGMCVWAIDHGDRYPAQVPFAEGGSMERIGSGSPAPHFQVLRATYPISPYVLACPTDSARLPLTNNDAGLTDRNLSYFLNVDATLRPVNAQVAALSGDRHLQVAGKPVQPGLLSIPPDAAVGWTDKLHKKSPRPGGNLLFADNHVEWTDTNLAASLQWPGLATNRLAFP